MKSILSILGKPMVALLSLMFIAPPASAETIRCESQNYRYRYCSIKTNNNVRLVREVSKTDCRQGQNWGYDSRGIWVDRGCAAEFEVHRRHSDKDNSGAALAGGLIVGALVAAAVAGGSDKSKVDYNQEEPPSWLVGRFEGYNPMYRSNVELNISPSGAVTGYSPDGPVHGWYNRQGRIGVGKAEYEVEQTRHGVILTEVNNPRNQVVYQRYR